MKKPQKNYTKLVVPQTTTKKPKAIYIRIYKRYTTKKRR